MSQSPPDPLSGTYICDTCGQVIPLQVCRQNKNGNAGRSFASCDRLREDGSKCKYFRWATPRNTPTSTPTSSPVILAAFPPPGPPIPTSVVTAVAVSFPTSIDTTPTSIQGPALTPVSIASVTTCAKRGCMSTRLHPQCVRQRCRKHCMEEGGCSGAKKHQLSPSQLPSFLPQQSEPSNGVNQVFVPAPTSIISASQPMPPSLASPSSSTMTVVSTLHPSFPADPRPAPRYVSQMPAVTGTGATLDCRV
jgi:hypothetical protein